MAGGRHQWSEAHWWRRDVDVGVDAAVCRAVNCLTHWQRRDVDVDMDVAHHGRGGPVRSALGGLTEVDFCVETAWEGEGDVVYRTGEEGEEDGQ